MAVGPAPPCDPQSPGCQHVSSATRHGYHHHTPIVASTSWPNALAVYCPVQAIAWVGVGCSQKERDRRVPFAHPGGAPGQETWRVNMAVLWQPENDHPPPSWQQVLTWSIFKAEITPPTP